MRHDFEEQILLSGLQVQKFCLICFKEFSYKKTDDLLLHHKTKHEENKVEALGYHSALMNSMGRSNFHHNDDLKHVTKAIIDFDFKAKALKEKMLALRALMVNVNPGMQDFKKNYSAFVNFDVFNKHQTGRILDGRLLIIDQIDHYENDPIAASKIMFSLRTLRCLKDTETHSEYVVDNVVYSHSGFGFLFHLPVLAQVNKI